MKEKTKSAAVGPIDELSAAVAVGQCVKGSSPGSRYMCVALSQKAAMAIRIAEDATLSVRVEPIAGAPSLTGDHALWTSLGLTVHANGSYASTHVTAASVTHACMGAAAFIVGFMAIAGSPCETLSMAGVLTLPGKGA